MLGGTLLLLMLALVFPLCALGESRADLTPRVPIILVPGWGHDLAPTLIGQEVFGRYRAWLVQSGFRQSDIHTVHYNYVAELSDIQREIAGQLRSILGHYPVRTRFDMMGHSLGGFVGMYAVMEAGLGTRLRKLISLSGIPFGWNSDLCSRGWCGRAHRQLTPFRSPFVMAFHSRHRRLLTAVEKCSLFSREDEFVRPYDAGKFSDGKNVEFHGRHMDVVWRHEPFQKMLRGCYGHT